MLHMFKVGNDKEAYVEDGVFWTIVFLYGNRI